MLDQPPLPVLFDAAGNEYVPRYPQPGLVTVSLCAAELLELWHWYSQCAAMAAAAGNAEWWSASERAAADRLALAVRLVPEVAQLRHQLPATGHGGRA